MTRNEDLKCSMSQSCTCKDCTMVVPLNRTWLIGFFQIVIGFFQIYWQFLLKFLFRFTVLLIFRSTHCHATVARTVWCLLACSIVFLFSALLIVMLLLRTQFDGSWHVQPYSRQAVGGSNQSTSHSGQSYPLSWLAAAQREYSLE
jgi:hypothetical protein